MENTPENDRAVESRLPESQERALRRSLLKVGVGMGTVVMARQAKSTMGVPYHCTMSGQISGNVSTHNGSESCQIGLSPGYWQQPKRFGNWPAGLTSPAIYQKVNGSWVLYTDANVPSLADIKDTSKFKVVSFSSGGTSYSGRLGTTLKDALGTTVGIKGITGLAASNRAVSLWELLAYGEDADAFLQPIGQFARHIAAAVLNAKTYANYPVSITQLRAMWDAVTGGGTSTTGTYSPMSGVNWTASQINSYLDGTWA